MKYLIGFILLVNSTYSFNQKILKDIHLYHSLKQEGEQFQFKVLDKDAKGVRFYKKDRFYYWYKAQHVLTTQGGSSGLLLNGEFESFYDSKQLSKKGGFKKGLKEGEWLYWRKDGTLIKSENWKKGKLNGLERHYNANGEPIQTINYKWLSSRRENADSIIVKKAGKPVETIYLKDSLGDVYHLENKKNGVLHGTVKNYENGKVVEKVNYKNGEIVQKKKDREVAEGDTVPTKKGWFDFLKKKDKTDKTDKTKSKDKNTKTQEVKPASKTKTEPKKQETPKTSGTKQETSKKQESKPKEKAKK